jgi:hypothetical protein
MFRSKSHSFKCVNISYAQVSRCEKCSGPDLHTSATKIMVPLNCVFEYFSSAILYVTTPISGVNE